MMRKYFQKTRKLISHIEIGIKRCVGIVGFLYLTDINKSYYTNP